MSGVHLTEAEVNALTGDDVAYWLNNPFLTPDDRTAKVRWWIGLALARGWDQGASSRQCRCFAFSDGECACGNYPSDRNPYREQIGGPA